MRRPGIAVALAAVILTAATAGGIGIAACGGSTAATTTQSVSQTLPAGQQPDMSAMFTTALDALVTKGTITSAQEDAVVAALKSAAPAGAPQGQSGSAPTPGATPTGRPPSGSAPGGGSGPGAMFTSTLDKLVSAGTITAAQEKAIVTALSSGMQGGPQGAAPGQSGAGTTTTTQTN